MSPDNNEMDRRNDAHKDENSERLRWKDQVFFARLSTLESKFDKFDDIFDKEMHDLRTCGMKEIEQIRLEIVEMKHMVKDMESKQSSYEPSIKSLKAVLDASVIMKWIVITVISAFGAVASVSAAWDTLGKWMK